MILSMNWRDLDLATDRSEVLRLIQNDRSVNQSALVPCSFIFQEVDSTRTEFELDHDIIFQIVDIKDIHKSDMAYIDELNGLVDINRSLVDKQRITHLPKNKQIINRVNIDTQDEEDTFSPSFSGKRMFKITLQDSFGNLCYAVEIEDLNFLRTNGDLYPISLGAKIIIKKSTKICLNTIMMKNENVEFLKGSIEILNVKLFERMLDFYKNKK